MQLYYTAIALQSINFTKYYIIRGNIYKFTCYSICQQMIKKITVLAKFKLETESDCWQFVRVTCEIVNV